MSVELLNSWFHNMDQPALFIYTISMYYNNSLSVKNCNFEHCNYKFGYLQEVMFGQISSCNMAISFENCNFYDNFTDILIQMYYFDPEHSCIHPTNTTFKNCNFTYNNSNVLTLVDDCRTNVIFEETLNIINNINDVIIDVTSMIVLMNGTVTISENHAHFAVMEFTFCDVTFTKIVKFSSNTCDNNLIQSYNNLIIIL